MTQQFPEGSNWSDCVGFPPQSSTRPLFVDPEARLLAAEQRIEALESKLDLLQNTFNDCMEAVQKKIGVNMSTDEDSLDFRVKCVELDVEWLKANGSN